MIKYSLTFLNLLKDIWDIIYILFVGWWFKPFLIALAIIAGGYIFIKLFIYIIYSVDRAQMKPKKVRVKKTKKTPLPAAPVSSVPSAPSGPRAEELFFDEDNCGAGFGDGLWFNDISIIGACNRYAEKITECAREKRTGSALEKGTRDAITLIEIIAGYANLGSRGYVKNISAEYISKLSNCSPLTSQVISDLKTALAELGDGAAIGPDRFGDIAEFLTEEAKEVFADSQLVCDAIAEKWGTDDVNNLILSSDDAEFGKICMYLSGKACGSPDLHEMSCFGKAALSLVFLSYMNMRGLTTDSGALWNMCMNLRDDYVISDEMYDKYGSTINALNARPSKGPGEMMKATLGVKEWPDFADEVTAAMKEAVIRIKEEARLAFDAEGETDIETGNTGDRALEETKETLAGLCEKAEEEYSRGNLMNAAIQGRYFIETILKVYCEAAGVDRSAIGLMEQIDYFKNSRMLEGEECSHLHAIRMVSNKGAHYDSDISAPEVAGMIRHMKAENELFGVD